MKRCDIKEGYEKIPRMILQNSGMLDFLNIFHFKNADFSRGYIAKSRKSKFFSLTVKCAVAHSVEQHLYQHDIYRESTTIS